jgi:hypothetical protein
VVCPSDLGPGSSNSFTTNSHIPRYENPLFIILGSSVKVRD